MAFRVERIEKIVEREISSMILFDCKDERLKKVTITGCKVSSDLSYATVLFTVYGNDEEKSESIDALNESKGYFRSQLAKRLDTRKTPEIRFRLDESLEYGNRIEEILRNLK